jgi:hypothetical protein
MTTSSTTGAGAGAAVIPFPETTFTAKKRRSKNKNDVVEIMVNPKREQRENGNVVTTTKEPSCSSSPQELVSSSSRPIRSPTTSPAKRQKLRNDHLQQQQQQQTQSSLDDSKLTFCCIQALSPSANDQFLLPAAQRRQATMTMASMSDEPAPATMRGVSSLLAANFMNRFQGVVACPEKVKQLQLVVVPPPHNMMDEDTLYHT